VGANLVVCIVQVASFKRRLNSQRLSASLLLSPPLDPPREAALLFLALEGRARVSLAGLFFGPFFFFLFAGVEFVESSERSLFELAPFLVGLDSWFCKPPKQFKRFCAASSRRSLAISFFNLLST
jgi:hypothetical protein